MKVYLDFVFLINFFFDFLLLFGTSKILKRAVSLGRLFLGSAVGSLSLIFLFCKFSSIQLLLVKIILSIFIVFCTFGKKNLLSNISYFYLLSIILGGFLYLFDISFSYKNSGVVFVRNGFFLNFFVILITAPTIIYYYVKQNIKYKNVVSNKYIVEIYINDKLYKMEGMLDTGNQLTDPYKKRAIIIVDLDIDVAKNKFIYVPYKALNTNGVIPCVKPDRVIIEEKIFSNCLVGLSKDKFMLDGASCILPNQFKEEL